MAYLSIGKPGTEYGPCKGKCKHTDCEMSRRDAAKKCRICAEAIGYDRNYCIEDKDNYVHFGCLLEEIDRQKEQIEKRRG